jgi:hypothetical protein
VSVNVDNIKKKGAVVFKEMKRMNNEESWFDAGYGELLRVSKPENEIDSVNLVIKPSSCMRYLAINSSSNQELLFIFSVSKQEFTAVLCLSQPVACFSWNRAFPMVLIATNSQYLYSWQPEGARTLPYPHGTVEGIEWQTEQWCLIKGHRSFSLAVSVNE